MHTRFSRLLVSIVLLLSVFSIMVAIVPSLGLVQAKLGVHSASFVKKYDIEKNCATDQHTPTNVKTYLTDFRCGHVTHFSNGTTLRQFTLIIKENQLVPITGPDPVQPIMFPAWTFNNTIPGPTMRMTEGDHVRITLINKGTMAHTLHMHSVHAGNVDGVPGLSSYSGMVQPGTQFTYDFVAAPYGVYPYHCHANPVVQHINRGLYGVMIIDPAHPRPAAHEMVMLLNGYHLNVTDINPRMPTSQEANIMIGTNETAAAANLKSVQDRQQIRSPLVPQQVSTTSAAIQNVSIPADQKADKPDVGEELDNDLYSVNGVAFYYYDHPIQLKVNEPQRVYLVNMLDFEENSFHMHGNLFEYYPSGTALNPILKNDMITMQQGDRGILEFTYPYVGKYMIHAHLDQVGGRGWMGAFDVVK